MEFSLLTVPKQREESLAAPYDGREVWVHSDLTPSNLLVSAEGRLTAVLDFETCGVGDPACDLFPAWYLLPANVLEIHCIVLGVTEEYVAIHLQRHDPISRVYEVDDVH